MRLDQTRVSEEGVDPAAGQSLASPVNRSGMLLVLFPLLMDFTHNRFPCPPFPAMLSLRLSWVWSYFNWVVPLGSQKEAIS